MNNNNENGQWSNNRSNASRDGKSNEKRNSFGNSRRYNNSENNRKYNDQNKSGYRSNENRNADQSEHHFNSDRPKRTFNSDKSRGDYHSDRPRNNYHSDKPRNNYDSDRPRNNYDSDKPRNNYDSDKPRNNFSSDRPRNSFNSDRKPFLNRENRNISSDRPRFERTDNRDRRNDRFDNRPNYRTRRDSNEEHGERKLSFRKASEINNNSEFVETRFDNKRNGVTFRKRTNSADYDPNNKYSKKKQLEHRKNFVDPTKPIRLNKFLANAGVCSRREADEYIQAGVISVNGEIITELGTKVLISDKVMFHNEPVRIERKIYLLLNKPKDCVTTSEDTHSRVTVLDLVKNACSERIYPVGRLDRNTTGVLLLTNDGDLASKLTHPKYDKKKIYHVGLDRELENDDFNAILQGIDLGDFTIKADALDFVKEESKSEVGIEIHSGQNRVVRRMFEKLGYRILKLDRVYFAGLTKKNVPRGKYRFLSGREINMLQMGAYE